VSVVVPALNEERSIDWVLGRIPSWVSEVVLVDGLSVDLTEAVARQSRPDIVVVHQRRRGKGAALRAGFAAAHGDIVVMLDADGSTDPREMRRFVDALRAGADLVKGSRHLHGGGSIDLTPVRRAGNRFFVHLSNLLFGSSFTDLCYGYCAFWRSHLDALALTSDGFEIEAELVLRAIEAGLVVAEVPSVERRRLAGASNLHVGRDGLRVLATMLRHWPRRRGARAAAPFALQRMEVASHETEAWRPAGGDRRRGERRAHLGRSTYRGPERRRGQRRARPQRTASIWLAHPAPAPRAASARSG
jgi:glycosyltransferase involved in cell wall biosynthesis